MGTIAGLNALLLMGFTAVLHDRLDPAAYLADAERLRVTSIGGAPALFAALLTRPDITTRDLSSVRAISSGAAPMPVEMIKRLRALAPDAVVSEGYGLTEVTMGATFGPAHRSGTAQGGHGRACRPSTPRCGSCRRGRRRGARRRARRGVHQAARR